MGNLARKEVDMANAFIVVQPERCEIMEFSTYLFVDPLAQY